MWVATVVLPIRTPRRRVLAVAVLALAALALLLAATAPAKPPKHGHGGNHGGGHGHHGGKGHGNGGKGGKHNDLAADGFRPAKGKILAGVSDTGAGSAYRNYRDKTGAHPSVMQSFESWGYVPKEAIKRWQESRTRGIISLSTGRCWGCKPVISSRSIAEGKGDGYLLALSRALADRKEPTYIRLLPEMNGHWNGYCAFNANGDPRGKADSTANFRAAWKRIVLIVRGGKRSKLDRALSKLGQPKVQGKTKAKLPQPKVAFGWVPQSAGSPNVPGNQPADYFPGYEYVDWVGGDIYSKFPNFGGLESLYDKYSKRPFMIGEWAPWGRDDPGFVKKLFGWAKRHDRVEMLVYYQGFGQGAVNEFEVTDYPKALKALRKQLAKPIFPRFTPENEKRKGNGGGGGKGHGHSHGHGHGGGGKGHGGKKGG